MRYLKPVKEAAKIARETARRTKEVIKRAREPLKKAAKVAIMVPFASLSVLSLAGCAPHEPAPKPIKPREPFIPSARPGTRGATPVREQLLWWPAYLMKDGKLIEVSLGFEKDTLLFDPAAMYASKEAIPQSKRDEMRTKIEAIVAYTKIFFTDAAANQLLEGLFFMQRPNQLGNAAGTFGGINPASVLDPNGAEVVNCSVTTTVCQVVTYYGDGTNAGKVLFHEFLHLAFSRLTPDEVNIFKAQSTAFFNVYGSTAEADRIFNNLSSGVYNSGETPNPYRTDQWVENWARNSSMFQELTDDERYNIIFSIQQYIKVRSGITGGKTENTTPEQRAAFTWYEAFAYMGANFPILDTFAQGGTPYGTRLVPQYMDWAYKRIGLRDEVVTQLVNWRFKSEEEFQKIIPYINAFVDYALGFFPELKTISQ